MRNLEDQIFEATKPLTLIDLFSELTKEPVMEGHVIEAKATGKASKCLLVNGLKAKLETGLITPSSQQFQCRINSIKCEIDHYEIIVSSKPEDISSYELLMKSLVLDKCFVIDNEDKKIENTKLINYVPRNIMHPKFKNFSQSQAIEFLSKKEAGEFVVRPSSKGDLYLTLTMKLYNSSYFHISIKEEEKGPTDSIGKTLKITSHSYNGLEDVIQNYAEPIKALSLMTISHRKFNNAASTVDQMKQKLLDERTKNSDIISYGFAIAVSYTHLTLPTKRIV